MTYGYAREMLLNVILHELKHGRHVLYARQRSVSCEIDEAEEWSYAGNPPTATISDRPRYGGRMS